MNIKIKRSTMIIFMIVLLMGLTLTGCRNNEDDYNNTPTDVTQTTIPPRGRDPNMRDTPADPNRPMPERNPDGTLG